MDPPETRYAQSGDLSIAYQVHGTGDHDLLFSGTTASNVETVWTLPEAHRFFERLGRFARVIRFDRRDTGVSDPIRDDLTLEAHVADALAVMDAAGAERPMLFGGLDGARAMAALAATRPERAAGLIALIPTVRGAADTPEVAEVVARSLVGDDWPSGLIDVWAPDWAGDPVRRDRLLRYIRTSSSPSQARRLLAMSLHSDVGEVLPLVQAPTLVLALADTPVSEAEQRQFAELIPGAVLRRMPGNSFMIYGLDVDLLADVIEEFVTGTAPPPVSSRILATVLFTDVVGSTDRVARVGDA
ncbi:MAG TPA: alpha/beta hydrolase, partial [Solirubrobacteraceae bacterium]|nr:alpha/beta hydrolase [Solirubrobacteraceae bacterium]